MYRYIYLLLLFPTLLSADEIKLDESPAKPFYEWGYHPDDGTVSQINPPGFCWRPMKNIDAWEIEICDRNRKGAVIYTAKQIEFNVHSPAEIFPAGEYTWRYRGSNQKGETSNWSQFRSFSIAKQAVEMPLPNRQDLLKRIPKSHPRLFLRPEDVPRLREQTKGTLKKQYQKLLKECDQLIKNPPDTTEPPRYGKNVKQRDETWRKIWWGNRVLTQRALGSSATLGFGWLMSEKKEYGEEAKRILLECAKWDPKGATGYRYNDEAGMPYNYYFVRTYTFIYELLSEEERDLCRKVMKIRGDEMYQHLYPRHLWRPYASHSNRAWHFLGEIGIAMQGEVEGADDWVWFAMNVFQNVYPVWGDDDGGWHEGTIYWYSYIGRFTWWADVMRSAFQINAYDKPYFSQIGYYPMYLVPPHKTGGGLGDLNAMRTAKHTVPLVSQLALQSGNGHWQWYVEQMGGPKEESGYIGFLRGALPQVPAVRPDKLPTSRFFKGIGQAYLNTNLIDARKDVQVVFKSSPFGTQSHGYEANNSFLLWAYGERLLIRSGYRDIYGSKHHKNWMWSTKSVNNITVNNQGQLAHSSLAKGKIIDFQTTSLLDAVVGEAGGAYRISSSKNKTQENKTLKKPLKKFTRSILFVKPELLIVYDRLIAEEPSTFEYRLHATKKFQIKNQKNIHLSVGKVDCEISFLMNEPLKISQTDQYDPNPRERIKLREWHLTASTTKRQKQTEFITLYRPHKQGENVPSTATLKKINGGYVLEATISDGSITALLPSDGKTKLVTQGLSTTGKLVIRRRNRDGKTIEKIRVSQ